jgi:ribosomal protein L29
MMAIAAKHRLGMPRANDINQMSNAELREALSKLRVEYMGDKSNVERGGTSPTGRMRETRRAIARILTVMNKRGIRPNAPSLEDLEAVGDDPHKIPDAARGRPEKATTGNHPRE